MKGGKKMTNYERIKNMSVEEMANLLDYLGKCPTNANIYSDDCFNTTCIDCQSKWIESEVDNNE